jgi:hypothetical protein
MRKRGLIWSLLVLAVFSSSVVKAEEAFGVASTRLRYFFIFLPLSVNGSKTMWFALDTGAVTSIISPEARQDLSLPAVNSGEALALVRKTGNKNAVVYAQSVKSMDVELGPENFVEAPVSFRFGKYELGRVPSDRAGFLGMDFLLKHGAVINCWTQQIFFPRGAARLPLTPARYEQMGFSYIPIQITPRGFVEVSGIVMGSTYSFLIDTGKGGTFLTSSIQKLAHPATHRAGVLLSAPKGGIENEPLVTGKLPGFKLGDHDLSDLEVCFGQLPSTDFGCSHEWGGFIGTGTLIRRHAIIDFGNRALYLIADKKK